MSNTRQQQARLKTSTAQANRTDTPTLTYLPLFLEPRGQRAASRALHARVRVACSHVKQGQKHAGVIRGLGCLGRTYPTIKTNTPSTDEPRHKTAQTPQTKPKGAHTHTQTREKQHDPSSRVVAGLQPVLLSKSMPPCTRCLAANPPVSIPPGVRWDCYFYPAAERH